MRKNRGEQKKKVEKEVVIVATPTYDGRLDAYYVQSLIQCIYLCANEGIQLVPLQMPNEAIIQRARNDLIQIFKSSNASQLVFIDSDVRFNANDLLKLIKSEKQIIGAAISRKGDAEINFNVKRLKDMVLKDGLIEVESVGTGLLKIRKEVVEKLWKISEKYIERDTEKAMIFEVAVRNNLFTSEDVNFCFKCRDAGFKIYIDPYIQCSHVGMKNYTANLMQILVANNLLKIEEK